MINVDISNIWGELSLPDLLSIEQEIGTAHAALMEGAGEERGPRGWLELPERRASGELVRILRAADQIRFQSEACVVLGTEGGCLGAQAAMELLQGPGRNFGCGKGDPQILYAGNSLSSRQWKELTGMLESRDFSVIAVSKSGEDLETAIALRSLRWMLERRYGTDEAKKRIFAVTDPAEGPLRQMAEENGWECFGVPADVYSPYDVLSPAGLLPMAAAGLDIVSMLEGAAQGRERYDLRSFENPVWLYAAVRNLMHRRGKAAELIAGFEPGFRTFGRWWQQLFARSEGKQGRGLLSVPVEYPQDLHTLGQLIREGQRNLFETVARFAPEEQAVTIGSDVCDLDGLNRLAGTSLAAVEEDTFLETVSDHADSGVPVITADCGELNEKTLGELFFFLQLACAVSAYTLGVNPFAGNGAQSL